jgi:hypothetical protein
LRYPGRATSRRSAPALTTRSVHLPKRNYGFEKRQKELNKQKKKEEKQQRKLERKEAAEERPGDTPDANGPDGRL